MNMRITIHSDELTKFARDWYEQSVGLVPEGHEWSAVTSCNGLEINVFRKPVPAPEASAEESPK